MTRSRFTADERRDLTLEYLSLPHGRRQPWLTSKGINARTMQDWRQSLTRLMFDGQMIPRGGVIVSAEENREMGRLHMENEQLRTKIARMEKRELSQERVIDALGKAIEVLQDVTADETSSQQRRRS